MQNILILTTAEDYIKKKKEKDMKLLSQFFFI